MYLSCPWSPPLLGQPLLQAAPPGQGVEVWSQQEFLGVDNHLNDDDFHLHVGRERQVRLEALGQGHEQVQGGQQVLVEDGWEGRGAQIRAESSPSSSARPPLKTQGLLQGPGDPKNPEPKDSGTWPGAPSPRHSRWDFGQRRFSAPHTPGSRGMSQSHH